VLVDTTSFFCVKQLSGDFLSVDIHGESGDLRACRQREEEGTLDEGAAVISKVMLDRDYGHVLVDMGIDSMGVEDYLGGSTVRRDDNPLRPGCVPGNQKEENGCYKPGNQGTYSRTAIHHRRAARIVRPFRIGWKRSATGVRSNAGHDFA